MVAPGERMAPEKFWERVRSEFGHRYPGFHDEAPTDPPTGQRRKRTSPSVVGNFAGRLWEIGFREPRVLAPDLQIGFTTAARLVEPAQMLSQWLPWVYAGERPRVLSKNVFDFDRIIMRYRRREGHFKGTLTGDPELDRRWGIYPYLDEAGEVFREEEVRAVLRLSARLSPNPKSAIPTLAVFGTEATLTLLVDPLPGHVPELTSAFEGFSRILDRLEVRLGSTSARQRPIEMDIVRDEFGGPFPVARFECPVCRVPTHPRYQANLETEVCEKCGKMLYRWT